MRKSPTDLIERKLKYPEAATHLGIEANTLRRWVSQGKGPRRLKINGAVRFRLSDLEAFLRDREVEN